MHSSPASTFYKGQKCYGTGYEMIDEIDRLRKALTTCVNHADDMKTVCRVAIEALSDKADAVGQFGIDPDEGLPTAEDVRGIMIQKEGRNDG